MTDNELKSDFSDAYQDYHGAWSGYLTEAQLDIEMHLGAHFTGKQVAQAKLTGRTLYPFNKTARQVDLIHGYEIRNRHVLKIGPVGKDDDYACQQHTALIMQQMSVGGYDMLSEAFKWGSLVTGSNLFELYKDREGCVKFGRRPYNSFLLDPSFTLTDLSDCRGIISGRWLHEDSVKLLLPAAADKIDAIQSKKAGRWTDNTRRAYKEDLRLYEEWWRQETDFVSMVISHLNGQEIPFSDFIKHPLIGGASNANVLIKNMRSPNGPVWSKFQKPRKKIKLTVLVDGEVIWDGDNPLGLDEYNFVWLGGEWAPECDRDELKLRSFTRRLRQPQYARDKRLNQAIDIIESQINAGKVIREGALVNEEDAYKTGQGQVVTVKKDFPGGLLDAFQQIQGVGIPAGVFQLIEILDKEETETTGLNQEIFGSDDKDIPGILHKYRTGQALTAQQDIFQGYRRAKWQLGIKMVKLNQLQSPMRVTRMLNEQPAPEFYKPDFTKYDCTPTEGLLTDSQRHLWFMELKNLYAMFPQLIPASMVIEAAPVQYKRELLERVRQTEQQQQQMMLAQLQTKQAMDQLIGAQAAENIAQAAEARAGAVFDKAKSLVEIQKLRGEPRLALIDRYLKLLEIMGQRQLPEGKK